MRRGRWEAHSHSHLRETPLYDIQVVRRAAPLELDMDRRVMHRWLLFVACRNLRGGMKPFPSVYSCRGAKVAPDPQRIGALAAEIKAQVFSAYSRNGRPPLGKCMQMYEGKRIRGLATGGVHASFGAGVRLRLRSAEDLPELREGILEGGEVVLPIRGR